MKIAKNNASANGVANRINFLAGSIDEVTGSADLVCANLSADVIIPMLPSLTGLTCGRLILSGILETQKDAVVDGLSKCGIADVEITQDDEWVAITT